MRLAHTAWHSEVAVMEFFLYWFQYVSLLSPNIWSYMQCALNKITVLENGK